MFLFILYLALPFLFLCLFFLSSSFHLFNCTLLSLPPFSWTIQETEYPVYVLDLMVMCWSQQPRLRPSASQIVSIASAPEFTHLLDVASLDHSLNIMDAIRVPPVLVKDEGKSFESLFLFLLMVLLGWRERVDVGGKLLLSAFLQSDRIAHFDDEL